VPATEVPRFESLLDLRIEPLAADARRAFFSGSSYSSASSMNYVIDDLPVALFSLFFSSPISLTSRSPNSIPSSESSTSVSAKLTLLIFLALLSLPFYPSISDSDGISRV